MKASLSSPSPSSHNKPSIERQKVSHVGIPDTSGSLHADHSREIPVESRDAKRLRLTQALEAELGLWLKQTLANGSLAGQRRTLIELLRCVNKR
jgi:hypothetical protein